MSLITCAKQWIVSLIRLFIPRQCVVCGKSLDEYEEALCLECSAKLPCTNYHRWQDNPVECSFLGKMPLVHATSYFYYHKGSDYTHILYALKYHGRKDVGEIMGRAMAADLQTSGFFHGIDIILPVPLHPKKLKARGYNQSEWLARGISAITGIPIDTTSVIRTVNNSTQTRKTAYERWENVDGIFAVHDAHSLIGKHILIVDDVLTTGSTITACADALTGVPGIRFSILTLAVAV